MVLPETGCSGRGDGDTTLLLLRHPVHRSGTFMYLTNAVNFFGIEKNALGSSGFASVNVSDNTNISCFFE